MPMSPYPLRCQLCSRPAAYKIAARWSDGVTQELKSYGLSCADCLALAFQSSRLRQAACKLASGENLEAPAIYELLSGRRDAELQRRVDLESTFKS